MPSFSEILHSLGPERPGEREEFLQLLKAQALDDYPQFRNLTPEQLEGVWEMCFGTDQKGVFTNPVPRNAYLFWRIGKAGIN